MNQYGCYGKNKHSHSSPQIEHHKSMLDYRSIKFGSRQHITTLDKHKIHIFIRGALFYMLLHATTSSH